MKKNQPVFLQLRDSPVALHLEEVRQALPSTNENHEITNTMDLLMGESLIAKNAPSWSPLPILQVIIAPSE